MYTKLTFYLIFFLLFFQCKKKEPIVEKKQRFPKKKQPQYETDEQAKTRRIKTSKQ